MSTSRFWNRLGFLLALSGAAYLYSYAQTAGPSKPCFLTEVEERSYAFGMTMANDIAHHRTAALSGRAGAFAKGFVEGLSVNSASFDAAMQAVEQARPTDAAATTKPTADLAYSYGVVALGRLPLEVDVPVADFDSIFLRRGMEAAQLRDTTCMTVKQANAYYKAYLRPLLQELHHRMEYQKAVALEKTLREAQQFFAQNARRKGVVALENGMQYEVFRKGKGRRPDRHQEVTLHYKETLLNGQEVKNTFEDGTPLTTRLVGFPPGAAEGVALMKPGATYRFYIPRDLAYGESAPFFTFPNGSAIIVELQLLDVHPE